MNIIGYLKDRYDPGMKHGLIIGLIIGVTVAILFYELGRGFSLPENLNTVKREVSKPPLGPGRLYSDKEIRCMCGAVRYPDGDGGLGGIEPKLKRVIEGIEMGRGPRKKGGGKTWGR